LLKEMGKRLTDTVRSSDVVARLGGDEFVLLIQEVSEAKQVEVLRFHGIKRLPDDTRDVVLAGGKFNMSDVSAAIGLRQLEQWIQNGYGEGDVVADPQRIVAAAIDEFDQFDKLVDGGQP